MSPRKLPIHHVDAFTSELFRGNPAAVCPLDEWLPESTMQAIAAENNLSETAFFVARDDDAYELRWFTPKVEVDLCGHATLAAAYVLFTEIVPQADVVRFHSPISGALTVRRRDDLLVLDFPAQTPRPRDPEPALSEALGRAPGELLVSDRLLAIYETEQQVRDLEPDIAALVAVDIPVVVSAPGNDVDFVSRFFAPTKGIPEDPVTGSAHCTLVPYWAARLGKRELHARQVSARGGELFCVDRGDRVDIAGRAIRYLCGSIFV